MTPTPPEGVRERAREAIKRWDGHFGELELTAHQRDYLRSVIEQAFHAERAAALEEMAERSLEEANVRGQDDESRIFLLRQYHWLRRQAQREREGG